MGCRVAGLRASCLSSWGQRRSPGVCPDGCEHQGRRGPALRPGGPGSGLTWTPCGERGPQQDKAPCLLSFLWTRRTRPGSRLDANSWAGGQLARGPRDGQSCRPLWDEHPIQGVGEPRHPSLPLQSSGLRCASPLTHHLLTQRIVHDMNK